MLVLVPMNRPTIGEFIDFLQEVPQDELVPLAPGARRPPPPVALPDPPLPVVGERTPWPPPSPSPSPDPTPAPAAPVLKIRMGRRPEGGS